MLVSLLGAVPPDAHVKYQLTGCICIWKSAHVASGVRQLCSTFIHVQLAVKIGRQSYESIPSNYTWLLRYFILTQVSERMVLAQKAYILFYIKKQPENGHAVPAALPERPSTAPPVQHTPSLGGEDSLKPTNSSSGELFHYCSTSWAPVLLIKAFIGRHAGCCVTAPE